MAAGAAITDVVQVGESSSDCVVICLPVEHGIPMVFHIFQAKILRRGLVCSPSQPTACRRNSASVNVLAFRSEIAGDLTRCAFRGGTKGSEINSP